MSTFSIRDLEHLSGIKAHTIRIWEQRYELIKPKRTTTNIRYYDETDLKHILNVALLKEHGFKISRISQMTDQEMQREVMHLTERDLKYPEQIHALTIAMVDMDEKRFEKIISTCILKLGFESCMLNVIYPFLSKIGVLWQTGAINPAQEHFISNLVRQKLIVAIDGQYHKQDSDSKKFVLFLPDGEMHEIGLLFADYVIKSRKGMTFYLGQSLPLKDLRRIINIQKPDYLFTIITTTPGPANIQDYVNELAKEFSDIELLLTGYQVVGQDIQAPENVTILAKIDDLIQLMDEVNS
ncbi:MAG: MerR family transcriptional regulator [Cyclobacteriaceae bacterium]